MKNSILISLVAVLMWCGPALAADSIRQARYQGRFYPGSQDQLSRMIDKLVRQGGDAGEKMGAGRLKALIMPHAGYIYSGSTAGYGAALIRGQGYKKVIIIGPDHRIGFSGCSVSRADAWQTPLGRVALHSDARTLLGRPDLFHFHAGSDRLEHSVEVVLPFVQASLDEFSLVPVVAGFCDVKQTAPAIEALLDRDTLLIASSDLSHYLSYGAAVEKDRDTIRMIMDGDTRGLQKADNAACGKIPVLMLMDIAQKRGWQPRLLHYANSGDTAGSKSRVVGYCAIAYLAAAQDTMSREQGDVLVRCARNALARRFGENPETPQIPEDSPLNRNGATFVTLYLDGRLRGCIGSFQAVEPLVKSAGRNAVSAAFRDPRFPPLSAAEFQRITISVSVLTRPAPLAYDSGADLPSRLHPGRDGVIIQKGGHRATFLPQVWEQLPTPEAFLSRLCRKAGLKADEWRSGDLAVSTYQVRYFSEDR